MAYFKSYRDYNYNGSGKESKSKSSSAASKTFRSYGSYDYDEDLIQARRDQEEEEKRKREEIADRAARKAALIEWEKEKGAREDYGGGIGGLWGRAVDVVSGDTPQDRARRIKQYTDTDPANLDAKLPDVPKSDKEKGMRASYAGGLAGVWEKAVDIPSGDTPQDRYRRVQDKKKQELDKKRKEEEQQEEILLKAWKKAKLTEVRQQYLKGEIPEEQLNSIVSSITTAYEPAFKADQMYTPDGIAEKAGLVALNIGQYNPVEGLGEIADFASTLTDDTPLRFTQKLLDPISKLQTFGDTRGTVADPSRMGRGWREAAEIAQQLGLMANMSAPLPTGKLRLFTSAVRKLGTSGFFSDIATETIEENLDQGKGKGEAVLKGVTNAAVQTAVERVSNKFQLGKTGGVGKITGKAIPGLDKADDLIPKRLMGMFAGALAEGGEEAVQQLSDNLLNDRPWDEGLSESAIKAVMYGGIIQTGLQTFDAASNKQQRKAAEKQAELDAQTETTQDKTANQLEYEGLDGEVLEAPAFERQRAEARKQAELDAQLKEARKRGDIKAKKKITEEMGKQQQEGEAKPTDEDGAAAGEKVSIKYPEAKDLPEDVRETIGDKEKLTKKDLDTLGVRFNKTDMKTIIKSIDGLKKNAQFVVAKDAEGDLALTYKDDNHDMSIKLTALGIQRERLEQAGIKPGMVVDATDLKGKGRAPVIEKDGVNYMVAAPTQDYDRVVNKKTGETLGQVVEKLEGYGWAKADINKYVDAVLNPDKAQQKKKQRKGKLSDLNPTKGVFVEYTPWIRAKMPLADNITTVDKTTGGSPDDMITVYRGVPKGKQTEIVAGDFVSTLPELAKSYSGDGVVISKEVRKGDVLDDAESYTMGEETIYRPGADKEILQAQGVLTKAEVKVLRDYTDLITGELESGNTGKDAVILDIRDENALRKQAKNIFAKYNAPFNTQRSRDNIEVAAQLMERSKGTIKEVEQSKMSKEASPMAAGTGVGAVPRTIVQRPETEKAITAKKLSKDETFITAKQIIDKFEKNFNVPIRRGRMRMRKALGEHHTREEIIRLREHIGGNVEGRAIGVTAHEVGHNISKKVPELKAIKTKNKELTAIATQPGKGGSKGEEGLAEFFRYYVVNPTGIQQAAPETYKKVDSLLKDKYPEIYRNLMEARADYQLYMEMPSVQKVMSQISYSDRKGGVRDRVRTGMDKFYTDWVNNLYPIEQLEKRVKQEGTKIADKDKPSIRAFLSRGLYGNAKTFLEFGTLGQNKYIEEDGKLKLNVTGKGFKEITKEVYDNGVENEFDAYLVAKRAIELEGRKIGTGLDKADAEAAIQQLEQKYPYFAETQKEIVKFQDRVMEYVRDSGLISHESFVNMRSMNQEYVPFFRVYEEAARKGYMGKGYANLHAGIKKIKGSDREIISPLESIVKNTYTMLQSAELNKVGQGLASLSKNNKIAAQEFERLKTPQAKVASVKLSDFGVIEAKGGINMDGAVIEYDLNPEEIINIFRPMFQDNRQRIVTVMDGGKKEFYYVDDTALYESIRQLGEEDVNTVTRILSAPARTLRAGATLTPDFIARNPIRDQMSAWMYSKYGYVPLVDMAKGMYSLVKKNDAYWKWQASGAPYSTLVSVDRDYMKRQIQEATGKKPLKTKLNPLNALRELSELMESATRLGEFQKGIKKGDDPIRAAMASKEVTLNFQRYGNRGRTLNKVSAFFNANVQDWDKMIRQHRKHPVKTTLKGVIGITLPSMLLYMLNRDEEWYQELPDWEKDTFWHFKVGGTIVRIPKPFLLGAVYGSIPERVMGQIMDDDRNMAQISDVILDNFPVNLDSVLPTAAKPAIEVATGYDLFLDRPIIPQSEEYLEQHLQYGTGTSEVAKIMSENGINLAPREIDKLISGYFAGLGRYGVQTTDYILDQFGVVDRPARADEGLKDIPAVSGYVSRDPYGSGSKSVEKFYDGYERATKVERSAKRIAEVGSEEEAQKYLDENSEGKLAPHYRKIAGVLSDIRKDIRNVQLDKDMSSREKKIAIDELNKTMTYVAREALKFDPNYNSSPPTALPSYTSYNDEVNRLVNEGNISAAREKAREYNKLIDDYYGSLDLPDFELKSRKISTDWDALLRRKD